MKTETEASRQKVFAELLLLLLLLLPVVVVIFNLLGMIVKRHEKNKRKKSAKLWRSILLGGIVLSVAAC